MFKQCYHDSSGPSAGLAPAAAWPRLEGIVLGAAGQTQWDVVLPVAGPWQGQSRAVRSRLAVLRAGGVRGKLVLGMPFKKLMERRGPMETRLTYITRSPNGSSIN